MISSEENEALKTNFEEKLQKLKDEHEKENNQMREDYGFVIATLKLGGSSDAIIELQAKINEQEHEIQMVKREFSIEKVNLVNKFKRAESASMFALRRNEEMSNKIYAMQIELEEMDDKHQVEIESYQEKLSTLDGEKGKTRETEKQGGNLKNKRKLMKKELEELRNEHERKMESFANKIHEEKNGELNEMTEKISKLEIMINEMKIGHIRAIKSLEESHRDEKVESLTNQIQRVKQLEAECLTLKVESEKKIEDLNMEHKEEVDKLRKYYEQEIGALKRRKVNKSQAIRRKTSVDTASLILKALKEQNERDEQEEVAKKTNSNIENDFVKNMAQNTVDDMELQTSMEKIRITYSEEFRNPTTTDNLSDSDKLMQLINEKETLAKRLNEVEEAHKREMQVMTDKYTEMKTTLENQICTLKNNENVDTNKSQNGISKNETHKEFAVKNIKQSIQRFDKRMEAMREKQFSLNKEEENSEENKEKQDEVDTKENLPQTDKKGSSKIPPCDTNGSFPRPSVEIMLKLGQNQESILSRKASVILPGSPKIVEKSHRISAHQRPDPGGLNPGSSFPRLRTNLARRTSGTVQRRKTLYENIYIGVPTEDTET